MTTKDLCFVLAAPCFASLGGPSQAEDAYASAEAVASCIEEYADTERSDAIVFRNICAEPVYLTYLRRDLPQYRAATMRLAPQEAESTGLSAGEAPLGFTVAVCPEGAMPVAPDGSYWRGEHFLCRRS